MNVPKIQQAPASYWALQLKIIQRRQRNNHMLEAASLQIDTYLVWEMQWPNNYRAGNKRSEFKPWPWTLRCIIGQDTLI